MIRPHIRTLTDEEIPIPKKDDKEIQRKPITGDKQKKVYNILRRSFRPKSVKELESIFALKDVKDISRTLRTLKKKGWVRRIPKDIKIPDPKWEAAP